MNISKESNSHQSPLRKAAQSISAVLLCPLSKYSHKRFRCTMLILGMGKFADSSNSDTWKM